MSMKYKIEDEVPSDILCNRLDELSIAVTKGRRSVLRNFDMRVPAECDRDADLVLKAAAKRIRLLEIELVLEKTPTVYLEVPELYDALEENRKLATSGPVKIGDPMKKKLSPCKKWIKAE